MSGIPTIPAGAQLGGDGTAENQAAAQAPAVPKIPQAPVEPPAPLAPNGHNAPVGAPPVPVWNGTAWELPQVQPQGQPQGQAPLSTPLVPTPPSTPVPTPENPPVIEKSEKVEQAPSTGATYLETTVNHFASEIGSTPEAIMGSIEKALEHGDVSLISVAELGTLTPEQTQRATQLAQMVYQHTQQEITNMQTAVYAAAGGQAQWDAAIQAFNASATDDAKGYVAYLADNAGNAKAAAEYVIKYVQQSGLATQVNKPQVHGGTGAPVATGLSVQEYKNGIHEIEVLRNERKITQSEYDVRMADLDYRRGVGRQQGR